jgi:hypothetical protein
VGICTPDAVSYVLSVHAIRAIGAIPSPLCGVPTITGMATQLTECGARILITGPPLVQPALAAVERSWVRQVISFGDEPGTVTFSSLLTRGSWQPARSSGGDLALLRYEIGPGGGLIAVQMTYDGLASELRRLAAQTPLTGQDVVIAAAPVGQGRAYGPLIDLALLAGAMIVAADGPDIADAALAHGGTAAIVHPGTPLPAGLSLRTFTAAR